MSKKVRKAYPGKDERIAMATAKIARLEKLNAQREKNIAAQEAQLGRRKALLEKSQNILAKEIAKRDRLVNGTGRAARTEDKAFFAEIKQFVGDLSNDEIKAALKAAADAKKA